jgi:hypothetical protein
MQMNDLTELYDRDYNSWLAETTSLLCQGQLDKLDCEHLIEELEALGRNEKNAVESLVIQIIIHLLLYQYWQQERDFNTRHWQTELFTFRTQLELRLTTNLKNYLSTRLNYLYSKAAKTAQLKSGLQLPNNNPYSLEPILDENWLPSG